MKAHFEVEANVSAAATGNADAIVDIKPSCIQKVLGAAVDSVSDVAAGVNASSSVVATVQ